ncbi:hypothetical protein NLI96_g4396 [Meripilus lineatus]|uniref:Uncharacterized protein n=1 Tax=Meripilus lineatus TaxID=2056292 RepID=A0AAD5V6Z7_9APHY|nr:hypothetical protein NLI96_g4396 [Physisporinus lineatus]
MSSPSSTPIESTYADDTNTSFVIGVYFILATLLFAALGLLVARAFVSSPNAPPEYEEVPSCEVDVERTAELDKENGEIVFVTKKIKRMNIRQYLAEQRMMHALTEAGFM